MNFEDMDDSMKKFESLIWFGEFEEAEPLFGDRMKDEYMQIVIEILKTFQKITHDLDEEVALLNKQLKSCRRDLFYLRKRHGENRGTIKMHLETNADVRDIKVEDFFEN